MLYFNILDFFLRNAICRSLKKNVTAPWHSTFIWHEFMVLDRNLSKEDPGDPQVKYVPALGLAGPLARVTGDDPNFVLNGNSVSAIPQKPLPKASSRCKVLLCPQQLPLCSCHVLLYVVHGKEESLPAERKALVWLWLGTDSGWRSIAQDSREKELAEMPALRLLLLRALQRLLEQQLALIGRELPKTFSAVKHCSFPTKHWAQSSPLDVMQAGTLGGLHQPVVVVILACCLGSSHSNCCCMLHLSDSSLYHQFYCIAQNQF